MFSPSTIKIKVVLKIFSLAIPIFMMISCEKRSQEFSLIGSVNNIENGTILYLLDAEENVVIDSTHIENNMFRFDTSLPNPSLRAILKNVDDSLYKMLWLENKPMEFNTMGDSFSKGEVFGSKIEITYNNFLEAIDTMSRKQGRLLSMKFVGDNSDNILGSYVLSTSFISWKKKKTDSLYRLLSLENKNSVYGKNIQRYLELSKEPKIGEPYANFEMEDVFGKQRKLSDLEGKMILLEFWASTCAPCRQYNPKLVETYKKYSQYGFEIFAVSMDTSKESWIKAIEKDDLKWIHVGDLKGWLSEPAVIYGISAIPNNFLIDSNGIIINRDLSVNELDKILEGKISIKL